MAIIPSTDYAGQIDTSDPTGYPHGKAKNVTVAGDGTGTPLEKAWVNDAWGFFQALLARAGITPSGAPDEVGASDYLDALEQRYREVWPIIGTRLVNKDTSPFGTDIFGVTIVWEPTQEKFYASVLEDTTKDWLAHESTDGITWSGGTPINYDDTSISPPGQVAYCPDNDKIGAASEAGFHLSSISSTAGFSTTPTGTFDSITAGCHGLVWDDTNNLWIAIGTITGSDGYIETASASGTSWTERDTEAAAAAQSIAHDRAGQTVVTYGDTDLMHYSSNGTTWTRQSTGWGRTWTRVWWCPFASLFIAYETTSSELFWSANGDVWNQCPFPSVRDVIVCENFALFTDVTSEEMHFVGSAEAIKGDSPFINMGFAVTSSTDDLAPEGARWRWQGSSASFSYYNKNSKLVNCTFGA